MNTWRRGCESAHCIEVDMEPAWISACDSASCVEVQAGSVVKIRDSKDPDGPVLTFTYQEWENFKEGIKNGIFG